MHHPFYYVLQLPLLYIDHSGEKRWRAAVAWTNLDLQAMLTQTSRIFGGQWHYLILREYEAAWCSRVLGWICAARGSLSTQYHIQRPTSNESIGCWVGGEGRKQEASMQERVRSVFDLFFISGGKSRPLSHKINGISTKSLFVTFVSPGSPHPATLPERRRNQY